jgi:hypothetical protein
MSEGQGNPVRSPAVVVNDDDETPSLIDATTGRLLITNRVGVRIIELSDGEHSPDVISQSLADEFTGADIETVRQHVATFLAETTAKGLVTWTG